MVLNTLIEYAFKKKWQKRWEWYIRVDGDYFGGDGGQQAKN
jgi:hypothetical protein